MKQRSPFGGHRRRAMQKRAAKTGQPAPLEKEIAGNTFVVLRSVGYHCSSTMQSRASKQTIGIPDAFVAHPAFQVFAWIEFKRPGEKVRPTQAEWHETVRASGCPVLVVTSPEDAIAQLERLRAERRAG